MQPKVIAAILGGVVLVGGGVWAVSSGIDEPKGPEIPQDLTVDAMKKQANEDPTKLMDRMDEVRRGDDLSDEQRQQVRRNMRTVWRDEMNKRMDEYFAATSEEEKNAILDRQIDEFQKFREQMRERREQRRAEREANGEDGEKDGEGDGPPWRRGNQTRDQRQNRSEGRSPDQMAKMMTYFGAMRARASARGIQMGGPPGRGGRGGGRGGR